MPSLIPRSKKLRTVLIVAASFVVIAVVAAVVASLGGSGSPKTARHADNSVGLTLAIGTVKVQDAGPPAKISGSVRQTLLDASQSYVDDALLDPLDKGRVGGAYEKLFDAGVKGPASGRDRATLTDANVGAVGKPVRASASRVRLDGLGDELGKLAFVAATFTTNVDTRTSDGPLAIRRHTELTFANEHGRWLVTAYRVSVRRSSGASTTTTTARSGTKGTS